MTGTVLIAAAAVVLVVLVIVIVVVAMRARGRSAAPLPAASSGPSSPTAIVCSFCKREYEPAEAGGRCPACGAATPRGR